MYRTSDSIRRIFLNYSTISTHAQKINPILGNDFPFYPCPMPQYRMDEMKNFLYFVVQSRINSIHEFFLMFTCFKPRLWSLYAVNPRGLAHARFARYWPDSLHYRYGGIRLIKFGKKSNMAAKVTDDKVESIRIILNIFFTFPFFNFPGFAVTCYFYTLSPASKSYASARLENVQLKSWKRSVLYYPFLFQLDNTTG